MPSPISPQWHDKASDFFQSSGVKLKEAGQSAGTFLGEAAKDAKENATDVAGKFGSAVKSRWAIFQQPSTRHAMQEHLISAAATTSMFLRRGFRRQKKRFAIPTKVAKKTAEKSKNLLTDIERWQKGVASTDAVQYTNSKYIDEVCRYPHIIRTELQGVVQSTRGQKVLRLLVSLYNQEPNASLPEGLKAVDVAALIKYYIASLPEPLTTFELYNEIKNTRSSIHLMREILKKLPTVNYMTLELITSLLLRVSQKSPLNGMDARSLAIEIAPIIMWQKGHRPEHYEHFCDQPSKLDSKANVDSASNYRALDMLPEDDGATQDVSSSIPLNDGVPLDFHAIEVIQCLIEQHNAVFTDANETVWDSGGGLWLEFLEDNVRESRMERNENGLIGDNSSPNPPFTDGDAGSVSSSNFFLDHVGEVVLTHNSDGLSWKLVGSLHTYESSLGTAERSISGHSLEMYRFTMHVVHKSKTQTSLWTPSVYTFGHKNLEICKTWVNQINASLHMEAERPKNLLVFVHPKSGKGHGCRIWEAVAPLFSQAKVKTKVIMTERAGHARDILVSITNKDLSLYDGVVAVWLLVHFVQYLCSSFSFLVLVLFLLVTQWPKGNWANMVVMDFSMKFLILSLLRHKAPYPPAPGNFMHPVESEWNVSVHNVERTVFEPCKHNEDESPLLTGSEHVGPQSQICEQDPEFLFPNEKFRFGIIPAGSTDAIVICTTGARDPVTSALHIILGKRVHLDIAQVVRWKETHASNEEPCVRYAASFAGYGFYGDVITESEKYRWMGPKRYDYAGTKVFLQHRSYEAEVNYLEIEPENSISGPETDPQVSDSTLWCLPENLAGVGAAVISCRNEKAPDGLVADAHLSDGHLIHLARKGGDPLDFNFVEHHKTSAFTFTSFGKEGVWNVDGELFRAHQLSAQVFRGLVSLFATVYHCPEIVQTDKSNNIKDFGKDSTRSHYSAPTRRLTLSLQPNFMNAALCMVTILFIQEEIKFYGLEFIIELLAIRDCRPHRIAHVNFSSV
ncbi:UNVERIFIED_CONTAM: Ceramide kinase [Sesamum angustifolium]|uniref:Ceramide kinase n=1 Tax=Sesamum angustifolium TaxID=2727405 RepID=A0AAW2LHB4_9LAMI